MPIGPQLIRQFNTMQGTYAASGAVSCVVNPGPTIYSTFLECKTVGNALVSVVNMLADILSIEMYYGPKVIAKINAQDLSDILTEVGKPLQPGYLEIPHIPYWLEEQDEREMFALGTGDAQANGWAITIRVNFKGTVTNVAKITAIGLVDLQTRPLGQYLAWETFPRTFSVIATEEINDLPKDDSDDAYMLMHFSDDRFSTMEVIANGVSLQDIYATKEVLQLRSLRSVPIRTVVSGKFLLDFAHRALMESLLMKGLRELKIRPTWTTAPGSYTVSTVRAVGLSQGNYFKNK
jgi:hypothetical protein